MAFQGGEDPAELSYIAHESARALLARVKNEPAGEIVEKVVHFTDQNGSDVLAELWAQSSAHSLPGSLWRLYLLRDMVRTQSEQMSVLYSSGLHVTHTADPVVAGAPTPAGPEEMRELADTILRGAFVGDFGAALHRAAAFSRVLSAGCTTQADDIEGIHPERATALTTQALRLSTIATELSVCAKLWHDGSLD